MIHDHSVSAVHFTPCRALDQERGLLGYLAFEHGLVHIDGVALRRTRNGRLELSYPERPRRHGRPHSIVRPRNEAAREALEVAILEAVFPRLAELGLVVTL